MAAPSDILQRKKDHLEIVLRGDGKASAPLTGFDDVRFEHCALPELDLDEIDLSTTFLGHRLKAPLLISSMTGGPQHAEMINSSLAQAARQLGIAFAVGSQRVAIEQAGSCGLDRRLREWIGDAMLLGNLGAAQLRCDDPVGIAQRAVDLIEADALIVHLNPLQEAVQNGGDRKWTGVLVAIERVAKGLSVPIVIKEVGCGISPRVAKRLINAGVSAIDCAGLGGTSWAQVEAQRAATARGRAVAEAFRDWGVPTARAIVDLRSAFGDVPLIASGGIRNGVECAKAVRLGADLVGNAAGLLAAATEGTDAVVDQIETVIEQLRIACFCTGSRDLAALRTAPLQ
ncbi:MAG: type 2 isopentenyl-diphosphate Delta-isomerase [Pseudomonadota bacterium]